MIIRLQDNPKIVVKPDYQPITVTGSTFYNFIGSGATTLTQTQTGNLVNVNVYTPIGSAQWGNILGDINTQTDLTNYVSTSISAATSGLTSSWNDLTDKPVWLTGTTIEAFQTGHTHQYSGLTGLPTLFDGDYNSLTNLPTLFDGDYNSLTNLPTLFDGDYDDLSNKPDLSIYLTGVTAPMVTGITASLYAPIVHTHPYSGLTGLPTLFSGNYDDLTDKPDLSVYQPVSGMSIYLTGVTWNTVTDKPELTLQSDFTGHTGNTSIHYAQSAITITESQISDFSNYALESELTGLTSTFNSHTGDTSIHYAMSGITITKSQVSDFPTLGSISTKDYWKGTQAQYDALGSYDNNTIYFIDE